MNNNTKKAKEGREKRVGGSGMGVVCGCVSWREDSVTGLDLLHII